MKNKQKIVSLLSVTSLLLASCALTPADDNKKPDTNLSVLENIQKSLDTAVQQKSSAQTSQLPDDVADALLPMTALSLPTGAVEKIEPRFDISVDRAYARQFFVSLVKDTPYNMIVHPDVKGKITLNLKDVTIPEVMDMVYNLYGYDYEKITGGFIVHPNKIQSRMFKMNYLNVTRQGQSATRVSSGQPSEQSTSTSSDRSTTTRESSSQSILAASNITTESSLDFWSEIQLAIESIIGKDENKSVVISPQSGLIIIRAYPGELRKAQEFLQSAEIIMQRQVILEAKIIEVELKDGYQQGINWAKLSNSGNTLIGQTGGGTLLENDASEIEGNIGNLDPNSFAQLAGNAVSAFGGMFTVAVKSGSFAAFFEFLETQGNMQILSSPRVSTVNNQKAVIKVGSDEFFVTDISTTTTSGVATTTTPDITLTPFFSGISLDVTPQIDEKGDIILHVHPTISKVTDQEKNINISDQNLTLPLAFSTVRESDSIVHARSGEIVVIGGLMTNTLVEKVAATPILSSIPILGELFKHYSEEEVKSELVILLKPIVIDDDANWSNVMNESSTRVKQIYHEYNN
jgi:MSHA biogenesis protein MshL